MAETCQLGRPFCLNKAAIGENTKPHICVGTVGRCCARGGKNITTAEWKVAGDGEGIFDFIDADRGGVIGATGWANALKAIHEDSSGDIDWMDNVFAVMDKSRVGKVSKVE